MPTNDMVIVDNSFDGLELALNIAKAGKKVVFASTNQEVVKGIADQHPAGVSRLELVRLIANRELVLTSDVPSALRDNKVGAVTRSGLKEGELSRELEPLFKMVGRELSPGYLVFYAGLGPPGTTEILLETLNKVSDLEANRDFHTLFLSPQPTFEKKYLLAGGTHEALSKGLDFLSTFIDRSQIISSTSIREAEAACLYSLLIKEILNDVACEVLFLSKQAGTDARTVLSLLEMEAPSTTFLDDRVEEQAKYVAQEETRLPIETRLIKEALKIRRTAMLAGLKNLRQLAKTIRHQTGVRKKVNILAIVDKETNAEEIGMYSPKRLTQLTTIKSSKFAEKMDEKNGQIDLLRRADIILLNTNLRAVEQYVETIVKDESRIINLNRLYNVMV